MNWLLKQLNLGEQTTGAILGDMLEQYYQDLVHNPEPSRIIYAENHDLPFELILAMDNLLRELKTIKEKYDSTTNNA